MIKPIVKTLSLSFVMLAGAAIASATEQIPLLNLAAVPAETLRVGCSSTAEIERGWEAQQQLLQERLAAKAAETVQVPGAIISTPLTEFMPQVRASAPAVNEGKEARTRSFGQRM